MCKILKVSKSKYYNWLNKPLGNRDKRMKELDLMIRSIFKEHKERYGSTRIYHELKAQGVACTRSTIATRMQKMRLVAKARKKFKVTTDSNHNLRVAENILNQDFTTTSSNEKWVSDISYIPTKEGWLYLKESFQEMLSFIVTAVASIVPRNINLY